MLLESPPLPLHSDVSLQMTVTELVPVALHFEPVWHVTVHGEELQSVLQSVPAVHVHAFVAVHEQPVPEQVAAGLLLLPQPADTTTPPKAANTIEIDMIRIGSRYHARGRRGGAGRPTFRALSPDEYSVAFCF